MTKTLIESWSWVEWPIVTMESRASELEAMWRNRYIPAEEHQRLQHVIARLSALAEAVDPRTAIDAPTATGSTSPTCPATGSAEQPSEKPHRPTYAMAS